MRQWTLIFGIFIFFCSGLVYPASFPVGSRSITYIDPARNNRSIPVEIYYPGVQSGSNVQVADGKFPIIIFGHGFAMVYTAYEYLWNNLVSKGYIMIFPKTEGSIFPAPNHLQFGLDLAFCLNKMKSEGSNSASPFYNRIAATSAIMGHSMGGGSSFLACKDNSSPTTMVTFAAANTNPSAITAAEDVLIPTLIFSGQNDCVAPPSQHQIPMYNALATGQKMMISINGGGHCYFADYNFYCSVGEGSCSPSPSLTRIQQQQTILDFLGLYFDFILKGHCNSWDMLNDSLVSSNRISFQKSWVISHLQQQIYLRPGWNPVSAYVNPINSDLATMFDPEVLSEFVALQSLNGIYFPEAGINTLNSWDSSSGYFLKVSENVDYSFCGKLLENQVMSLSTGWNLKPVPVNCSIEMDWIVEMLGNKLVILFSPAEGKVFWPSEGIYNIENLTPGFAYFINVSEVCEVEFPECP